MCEAFGCARLVVIGPELVAARAFVTEFVAEQEAAAGAKSSRDPSHYANFRQKTH
jgi:hypothetical protein